MILDKQFNGIMDQEKDCLIVYEQDKKDLLYSSSLNTMGHLNLVLDSIFERANSII